MHDEHCPPVSSGEWYDKAQKWKAENEGLWSALEQANKKIKVLEERLERIKKLMVGECEN